MTIINNPVLKMCCKTMAQSPLKRFISTAVTSHPPELYRPGNSVFQSTFKQAKYDYKSKLMPVS